MVAKEKDRSYLYKGTPKIMSTSAPEKYPPFMGGARSPFATPTQRLVFKTPDVLSSGFPRLPKSVHSKGGQRSGRFTEEQHSLRSHLLEGKVKIRSRLESDVRIGSGQTPMKGRFTTRLPHIADVPPAGVSGLRNAKSYSPLPSSPLCPHYSRSWSTIFCDPLLNDDCTLESMGEPLLPEMCVELVWVESDPRYV